VGAPGGNFNFRRRGMDFQRRFGTSVPKRAPRALTDEMLFTSLRVTHVSVTSRQLIKSPSSASIRVTESVVMARWGLIPFWMKEKPKVPHINARAETVDRLPLFREAFAKRRCLIPATGFYEWQQREDGKQPYRFHRKDLEPFAFAGIWEFVRLGGEEILSTAIIVGEANPLVGGIHDRMPVMLMSEDYDRWFAPTTSVSDLKALLKPYDPALMEAYAVSRAVNSVKNDTEECIEPVEDSPESLFLDDR
jgi:putative SOS response-associated peptidase YedK